MTPTPGNDALCPTLDELVIAAIELLDGFVVDADALAGSPWEDAER